MREETASRAAGRVGGGFPGPGPPSYAAGMQEQRQTALERALQRVVDREAQRIREAFIQGQGRPAPARPAFAYALAALVLLGYVLMAALGAWLVVWGFGWWGTGPSNGPRLTFALILAAPLLGYVALAFPRPQVPPGRVVTAEQAPEFHRLIGEVAAQLDVKAPERVQLDGDVNAFMGRAGLPPRPVLGLGLPLWYGLPAQERVAILAHELAHQRNGDPARGSLIWAALTMLAQAVQVLTPDGLGSGVPLVPYLLLALRLLPLGLYAALVSAIGAEQQTAEYRADLMAAQVAGSDAAAGALDKLHLSQALESALHKQRHMPERPHAFLELRHIWDTVPDAQRQHKREEYAARRARLDDSHPATVDRLQVVRAFPQPPALVLDEAWSARIDAELTPFVKPLEQQAFETYQERYAAW